MDSIRERDEVFSRAMKAGKRTYFFDVKETKAGERYLVITESKKKFNPDDASFSYEKHKIFLYKEDQQRFINTLQRMIDFVESGIEPSFADEDAAEEKSSIDSFDDLSFDTKE
jgi:Protein of unknown function (DUF3276).